MTTIRHSRLIAIFCGGLVAGTIDIGAAALINWLSPVTILHAIASGMLGTAAFHGGSFTAVLGLGLQWGMSLVIAAIFVTATSKLPVLIRRWIRAGTVYGVVIFLIMNYVVVPLSAAPWNPWKQHSTVEKLVENLLAMILFGLIVSFCAHSFVTRRAVDGAQLLGIHDLPPRETGRD